MPRWCYLESAECTGVAAIKDGQLSNCTAPNKSAIVYVLRTRRRLFNTNLISPAFAAYAMPIIRQRYAALTINSIVSVQPLNQPTGLVKYLHTPYKPEFDGDMVFDGTKAFERPKSGICFVQRAYLTKASRQLVLEAIKEFTGEFD